MEDVRDAVREGDYKFNGTTELSSSLLLALSVDEDVHSLLQGVSSLLPGLMMVEMHPELNSLNSHS